MKTKINYKHTIFASYISFITLSIVNNFTPLLFIIFQSEYSLSLDKITFLITANFLIQLIVDAICAKFVDKIGYKAAIVIAHFCATAGLAGLAILPSILANPYIGLLIAIAVYAVGGGIIEVVGSPIIEACPTENKSASMSLLHSFYCWGQMLVVLGSTLFFVTLGTENWKSLALIWAIIPLANAFFFMNVPVAHLHEDGEGMSIKELFSTKLFWLLALVMVCAGASELSMSQWASAFAELGIGVSKTLGDLAGPCMFALLMGISRVFYAKFSEKISLEKYIVGSGILCLFGYLLASLSPSPLFSLIGCGICGLAVGIMWPGTFSVASARCPRGGTAMFALLALAGDLGCSVGPTTVGLTSGASGDNISVGLLSAGIFPVLLVFCFLALRKNKKHT